MIKKVDNGLILNLKIIPNSSKNDIIIEEEFIKVKITAQPVENKANKSLIEFLSKRFKIPKTSFQIVKGETSKEKTIFIKSDNEQKIENVISLLKREEGI